MGFDRIIEHILLLKKEAVEPGLEKSTAQVIGLLEGLKKKDLPQEEKQRIADLAGSYLGEVKNHEDLKQGSKKLRKALTEDFGFVAVNYYLSLGIGLGLSLGASLGISLGAPFEKGLLFGPMIGTGLGLFIGLLIGMSLDKKKAAENRVLEGL